MIIPEDARAIEREQARDCDPARCAWCGGTGWQANPVDPEDVVPCDACSYAALDCEMCHAAPAVTLAGETALCVECDRLHGLRLARQFALDLQRYQTPLADLSDVPF